MAYSNFGLALYCTAPFLDKLDDLSEFDRSFGFLEKHLDVSKVYLESYRSGIHISREKLLSFRQYFNDRGIATSGGIATTSESEFANFHSLCYTREKDRAMLKAVVELTASLFDEIILDDFFFTNCKCDSCIKAKGERSWPEFRTALMQEVSKDIVIAPAKAVNPNVNLIIKYPNWYEHYQETGYNLAEEPGAFDMVYTGTETRDTKYTQQHLPGYLSYFLMRYLENVKPGKNGGGWFDIYECGSTESYVSQAQLTVFGKAREVTLFNLGSLLNEYAAFTPAAGFELRQLDGLAGVFGAPVGVPCYLPYHSCGEDYLHDYLGTAGIPLEPFPYFSQGRGDVLLTAGAACDKDIIEKVHQKLLAGGNVVVTSGFVAATDFGRLANVRVSSRKAFVNRYFYSKNGSSRFFGSAEAAEKVLIPQLEFGTNDICQFAAAEGEDNNFPILLMTRYGAGKLYILTVPDDYGGLYHYPPAILNLIRNAAAGGMEVRLEDSTKAALFCYDNGTFAVKSYLPTSESVKVVLDKPGAVLEDLATGRACEGSARDGKTVFDLALPSYRYRAFRYGR